MAQQRWNISSKGYHNQEKRHLKYMDKCKRMPKVWHRIRSDDFFNTIDSFDNLFEIESAKKWCYDFILRVKNKIDIRLFYELAKDNSNYLDLGSVSCTST